MMLASLLTSAFLVAGVCAYRIRKGVDGPATKMVLKTGIYTAALVIPLQILAGDLHGLNTLEHQPAKVAAMEGIWETQRGAGFTIVGIPDEEARETRYALKIPNAASLILTHELDGEVKGLNDFAEHPPVAPVFWSFRVMTGVGTLMLLVSWWGVWQLFRRGKLSNLALQAVSLMTFSGWVASVAGWYVTEIGRQPWIVQGLVSTTEVVAQHPSATLAGTLFGYVGLYLALMIAYMKALRIMAVKPAKSLEEDSNPLGTPLVGTTA
jgi:cytochrome d ubiquinol oxidase subunit I